LGDLLKSRRLRCFVDARPRIEILQAALDVDVPFSVLYVHGRPGT